MIVIIKEETIDLSITKNKPLYMSLFSFKKTYVLVNEKSDYGKDSI